MKFGELMLMFFVLGRWFWVNFVGVWMLSRIVLGCLVVVVNWVGVRLLLSVGVVVVVVVDVRLIFVLLLL